MVEASRWRKIAFLDTNALHYVSLYLMLAEQKGMYPFSSNVDTASTEACECLDGMDDKNNIKSLKKGLWIIERVSKEDLQIEYSPVSELELMAGRAKGRAIERAANEGIPNRMWSRFFEEEINDRLDIDDLTGIRSDVDELGDMFEAAGGIKATASNPNDTRDVFALAKMIGGLVYLGFADSVIYANALIVKADYLITSDGHLKRMADLIRTNTDHSEVKSQLIEALGESAAFALPEAVAPKLFEAGRQ